ncbi:hypothetical protein KUV47_09850 [Vannielia litorea]|uniref:hypothetical protein n=1 Tax=Vannielia litorea TaxID=1217970 RepID=UPI001C9525F4|nr:hypothetical protein [Vannielia litorea]MBY6046578.1 hypothetical protein [Vannielia litorea]MBY6073992.1 hypothetical protein [Vannielia litorea]MBY6153514.1 hypothetical protein [Vannielia litorea]
MADPTMQNFAGRIRRIEKIHRRGGGFEATGTLGQSFYTRSKRVKRPVLRPALTVLTVFLCFKALTLAHLGTADYTARLDGLRTGNNVQKVGAHLMAIDPITQAAAAGIKPLLR